MLLGHDVYVKCRIQIFNFKSRSGLVLIVSELLHKHVRTQPKCTEMFKNSNSVWPLKAVSKNRPFGHRSLSRNNLCLTLFTQLHIWHLHNNNADLRGGGRHWSVGIPGKVRPGLQPHEGGRWVASWLRPVVFAWTALSTFASGFLVPFSITVSKSGAEVKNSKSLYEILMNRKISSCPGI